MNIGEAVAVLKAGGKVRRAGWNGKGMWLVLVNGSGGRPILLTPGTPYYEALEYGARGPVGIAIDSHIDMYTAQGTMQPGWLASQADLLAEDWELA